MAYLNDPHPLLGDIQDGAEATEFDVGGEYRGTAMGAMICCVPEYTAMRMRLYHSRGVRSFLARHTQPDWPNKEFHDINDTAFYKLAWDIDADINGIWTGWAEKRFGTGLAPKMIEILKMTDEVVNKSIYIRGTCANRHYFIFPDNLDSYKYMAVDLSAMMIEGGIERLQPTPENIQAIIAEKEEAISLCREMIAKFRGVSSELPQEMRDKLDIAFRRTERITVIMRYLVEAMFNYFYYERCFSVRERDLIRPRILNMLKNCEQVIDQSQKLGLEQAPEDAAFGITRVIDFDRPRKMCEEIRALLNFRIFQKADSTISVTPSSQGHPNTYAHHRWNLREMFGLPGEG